MEKIEALWDLVIKYGTYVGSNNLNSRDYWVKLKQILKSNKTRFMWSQDTTNKFGEMKKMGIVKSHEIYGGIWELHHFYLQHTKIPFENKSDGTFVKLFQIAYDAGQLNVEMNIKKNPIYTDKWKKYYNDNNLNLPQEYVSNRDLNITNFSIGQLLINDVGDLLESIKK